MIYVPRRRARRKPKDILVLTLKTLRMDEEFCCTQRAYAQIKNRLELFSSTHKDWHYLNELDGAVQTIRRIV